MLENIRRKIQNDYYIIPSSVHEVLILLADSIGKEELNQMIQEVNATVVESREILAEHCYKYDSKKNRDYNTLKMKRGKKTELCVSILTRKV